MDAGCTGPLFTPRSRLRQSQEFLEGEGNNERILIMLYTIAVILLVLWLLGLVSSYTIGGFIHVLLVVAIVMFLVQVISGRGR